MIRDIAQTISEFYSTNLPNDDWRHFSNIQQILFHKSSKITMVVHQK